MVRETRHLWVGNLPDNIREDRIREHFKRYGRVQSVKLLPRCTEEKTGEITMACTVAFMDIKSASKAHNAELKIDDRTLNTEYYEPAAIPSSASSASIGGVGGVNVIGTTSSSTSSPSQNTPSPYSTSPAGSRFPNGHGSAADDHANFTASSSDRFSYDRSTSRNTSSAALSSSSAPVDVGGGSDFRRGGGGYHESAVTGGTSRLTGRNRGDRDRAYRATNGPSSSYLDTGSGTRSSRTTATGGGGSGVGSAPSSGGTTSSWSSYETNRYNSTGSSQADTGYSTTPSENDRRSSEQSSKKKTATKSRSGSRSASPSGSTSSRSPSRSRSRSSSSSSSSSTSRATSSTGSPKSRRITSSSNVNSNHQPVVHSDDRRPLAICVRNLPLRSSDTSLKDGLFHEYKKHGKVTWVKVVGQNSERHAIVCFKKPEDVEKALEVSYDKLFFGCKIEVAPYQGYDVEDNDLRPYEAEIDEYHPKATRTLFIGNLEKDVTASDLRKHFDQFGEIIEIDIKKQGAVSSYAFCQYSDIVSVVKAIRKMDGEHLGNNRIKLGFGKSMAYNCVWVDGINEHVNEKYLRIHFDTFGVINKVHIDRDKGQALIFYETVLSAQAAVSKMRGFVLKNNKLQVDFASRECQESFFERLEKQGNVLERSGVFDERREPSSRSFESSSIGRFSRYDASRPRTSSYSSRSSLTSNQVVSSSIQSPGGATPGSVTPRGAAGTRSSRSRFVGDYYDQAIDYPTERHFRSYDEYSQGSAASHDDVIVYEHEYTFVHDSPTHLDVLDSRSMQSIVVETVPFAPSDIRNLQKERVHLLEQLEECPSSSDELMSPKKRLKLDLLDSGADVIIEANRDHRKVMEVRRLSDTNLKHHSRRPSIDSSSKHSSRDLRHDIGYMPHTVCKRRKTASSDSGSRVHHYDHSGSESVGGSRPGTPLCDERPENLQPSEPRRVVTREREGPLTLPLPRFAAQVMNRGSVSVAGIKGQKDNVLSSPPAATSPRISNPRPPSPVHVPPPASPPPRPPSISSNSSDSDITPPSPSLEERIKSLDEKYEKWSGSRTFTTPATGDAMFLEKFRQRHKILDLDLKEVQPSEIVKSVMAKRSVFDEDLKRLENVGEKYEPKDFNLFPRVGSCSTLTNQQQQQQQTSVPVTPLSAPPTLKLAPITQLPKTPTMLSPRSAGTALPAAKGLQYPFPTHPPVLMSPIPPVLPQTPSTTTTVSTNSSGSLLTAISIANVTTTSITSLTTSSTIITSSTTSTRSIAACHGDNRLKPCASVASESTRTTSKVTVNRSNIVSSNKLPEKTIGGGDQVAPSSEKSSNKSVRETKSSDKTSEKVLTRRDSNSNSPRADIKTRRNSDTNARRIEESETTIKEKDQNEERKKERFEKIRQENEKLEKEKQEKERIEKERLEKEKQDKERLEREKIEKDRLERESELEKQRLEKERLEKEREEKLRLEREQAEKERIQKEKEEKERREREERERKERERKEREERERREREQQEKERKEKEEREREEQERKEREEKERREREERDKKEREEKERREKEEKERRLEEDRLEKERHEKEKQLERERKREEDRARHKEDNHDKRSDHKHREIHSETKHKDSTNIDKHLHDSKNTKDDKFSLQHEVSRRDTHSSHEKSKHHVEREERRKESIKENRDNNVHDKQKGIESRHLSIELDKNKALLDTNKRKERNNSVPANIGSKRRMSSHEIAEHPEEAKKIKLSHEHKKISERRDSRDSTRSEERSKSSSKHQKNNSVKSHDKHNSSKDCDEKRKDREREERHKKHKLEKQKSKSKSREKESQENQPMPKSPVTDKDFLARLDLKSAEETEKQKKDKEMTKQKSKELQPEEKDTKIIEERSKKEKEKPIEKQQNPLEKHTKNRSDNDSSFKSSEEKKPKRERVRKITNTSESDSDEPKKHSIFDIVDDEPAYISMYDKVKARSCKNMAKQEEEKRQEKIKAKFSQLKQSRAKREEKKRSTSWDEDSDSDKETSDVKVKRCPKMLIDSSDEENHDRKSRKKKDYSDSDSSAIMRQVKQEPMDTSEDEIKNKHLVKGNKSARIAGDTSEDEYNKKKVVVKSEIKNELKTELVSDDNTEDIDDKSHLTKVKEEMETLLNKERRNSKQLDIMEEETQLFNEITEIKQEKPNNRHNFVDNTSDEESHEISKKERREKKHKKKQKKQKHSISTEDVSKLDGVDSNQSETIEKSKHHEKKKDHSKKDKRRDKTKEGREKSKKSKKNKSENKSESKKEGKMENIFGSLSDDSETCTKEIEQQEQKIATFASEESQQPPVYASETEREHETKIKEKNEREKDREEHKRKKEKKRREKERRLQEAAAAAAAAAASCAAVSATAEQTSNENSMDFADMGKQLEENMLRDDSMEASEQITKDEESTFENTEDPFKFIDIPEVSKSKEKEERREGKEKKKKRKKSKEEKGKHHHHHHHDKSKYKSSENKKEHVILPPEEIKEEIDPPKPQDPSLPSLMDEPVVSEIKSPKKEPEEPVEESIIEEPSAEVVPEKEPTATKFLPGFGEIDEKIHESAVQSISQFVEKSPAVVKEEDEIKSDAAAELSEEKPRVVISQEETEDAVAALLGESFGSSGQFEECYDDDINESNDQSSALVEEANPQDDEEMRQAVQSLSTGDIDVKPDTPQSENELQIDTDTEEQDEVQQQPPRYDAPPKTPDIDLSRPKTPETTYFQNTPDSKTSMSTPATPATPTPLLIKAPSSPPSLTPIKSLSQAAIAEVTKVLDLEPKSLPLLPDNTRSVISQSWSEKKAETVAVTKEPESKLVATITETQSRIITASPVRVFTTPPVLKIAEPTVYPPLQPISKPEPTKLTPTTEIAKIPSSTPNISQMHNLPARPPVQNSSKPSTSIHEAVIQQTKLSTSMLHNRLPITSVMVSKPLQPTTVILQQSKIAHSLEPPKLVSTSEPRPQERPRMVFQTASIQPGQFPGGYPSNQPRMMVQGNIRHLPPQGLLVPSRQLNPSSYGYLGNMPHSTYNFIKDNMTPSSSADKKPIELQVKVTQPALITSQAIQSLPKTQTVLGIAPPLSLSQPLTLPKEQSPKPPTPTPTIQSPNQQSPKLPLQTSPIPKPSSSPMLSPVSKLVLPASPNPIMSQPIGTPPASSPSPKPPQTSFSVSTSSVTPSIIVKTPSESKEEPAPSTTITKELKALEERSITSSVIISTRKEEPLKVDEILPQVQEPVKLAIEKVTEELNMSLDKEIREHTENKPEIVEEKQPENVEEKVSLPLANKPLEKVLETKIITPQEKNPNVSKNSSSESKKPTPELKNLTSGSTNPTSEQKHTMFEQKHPTFEQKHPTFEQKHPTFEQKHPTFEPKHPTFDQKHPTFEQKLPTFEQKLPTFEPKHPTFEQKLPTFEPKHPTFEPKHPTFEQKLHTFEQKLPTFELKHTTFEQKHPTFESKHPYSDEKIEESKETIIANKEVEKIVEEKADTESIISDISKERLSADLLAKDDPLDTKEDSDYWSAKEVNIDSVIKTLCSADELSDHSSENGKDDWDNSIKSDNPFVSEPTEKEPPLDKKEEKEESVNESKSDESEITREENAEPEEEPKEITAARTPNRGRGARGRGRGKTRGTIERGGIQTRRGKLAITPTPPIPTLTTLALPSTPTKRGRITRAKPERKTSKAELESSPADIYEFRDEPDDSNKEQRPRLILTIKSPAISNSNNAQTTAIVKEVTKDGAKEIGKEAVPVHSAVVKTITEPKEFASPTATNKRKSKRLQEKDIRNTVDDTIEDVVKNNVTKAATNQRRSTRQSTPKVSPVPQTETPRKSPRGRKTRRGSEATETSSSEETSREDMSKSVQSPPKEVEKIKEPEREIETAEPPKEKPVEGLKAAFLRRVKGEQGATTIVANAPSAQREPTNLIDPVTGEIIPMRECEEGKYIPLPGTKPNESKPEEPSAPKEVVRPPLETKLVEVSKIQPSVIAQPQPITIIQQSKPQTLKSHVLSSQAAQAAHLSTVGPVQPPPVQAKLTVHPTSIVAVKNPTVAVLPPSSLPARTLINPVSGAKSVSSVVISKTVTPIVASKVATPVLAKPPGPISQHLNVNTSLGMGVVTSTHLSPRPNIPLTVTTKPPMPTKQIVKPPVLSPVLALNQQKQILQTTKSQQPMTKAHLSTPVMTNQPQIVNTQLAHIKHQPVLKQQIIIGKGPIVKQTHPLHPQQMLTAAVPSPPLSKSQSTLSTGPRIIQGPTPVGPKGIMEPPKVDVSMANVMLGQRPKLSPQGPHQRIVGQAGMPVPGYEASLGEAITHFPPGPLRPDLNPAHYMHPSHLMHYQQYVRQQQLHLARTGGVEKVGDGQEGEEAPVTSPPLELRRPGSVGMALAGRGAAVPHSVHSPHDRATDSPQVGQVYNVLSDRMPPYYTANRFFEHAEPPPAHQQINSHAPLAALGSDRGRAVHITSMGTPDRPLSGGHQALSAHMGSLANTPERSALSALGPPDRASLGGLGTADRPLSSHIERPLSSATTHSMMGACLGAAGNLMGAVARHIGADAPTSQRGLQAATPPHASQVPPQAESLFIMLMKQYPCMWQGLLALKNDQAAVQMYFVSGNDDVAKCSLPKNTDGSTPPLRIFQRMRLEPPQVEGVARKIQMENEHCMLLALPCGHDHMDVLKQSTNLTNGFITYLQQKQAAGIINVAAPGTTQPPAYVVHIFPSCDFVNENLRRIAPSLLERVADIAHLLIVITTV